MRALGVPRKDDYRVVPVIVRKDHQLRQSLLAEGIAVSGHEVVRLIHKNDTAHARGDALFAVPVKHLPDLCGRLAGVACDEIRSTDLLEVVRADQAKRVVQLADLTRNRSLARALRPLEDHVHCSDVGLPPTLDNQSVNVGRVREGVDLLLDVFKPGERVDFANYTLYPISVDDGAGGSAAQVFNT